MTRAAFHWRGEEGEERDLTYAELLDEVQRLANALKGPGNPQGEVIGIFLPMIPEVIVVMLTCARIGGPHTVVFGGFATATAVRERLNVSQAKALIVADAASRKGKLIPVKQQVDEVISDLPDLETVVVVLRGQLSERLALGPPRGRGPRGGPWCGGGGGGGFPSG